MNERFIRMKEVLHLTGLSKSTMYSLIKEGLFPKQIRVSDQTVVWLESEIKDWMERKITERHDPPIVD